MGLGQIALLKNRQWRSSTIVDLTVGLLLGCAVCFPFLGSHRLLLLDWAFGPRLSFISPSLVGLNGGLTAGVPAYEVTALLNHVVGSAVSWPPLLLFFPLATTSMGSLVGGNLQRRIPAELLYAVNPFVFNRIFVGHVPLLIGYALMPWAMKSLLTFSRSRRAHVCRVALWWAALTACSVHYAWIFGDCVVVVFAAAFVLRVLPRREVLLRVGGVVAGFVATSVYLWLPPLLTKVQLATGSANLQLFQTTPDPHYGLFFNVAAMYGFWRIGPGPALPKDVIAGWPFLIIGLFALALLGVRTVWSTTHRTKSKHHDDARDAASTTVPSSDDAVHESAGVTSANRLLLISLVVVAVTGYLLALGAQGPTGAVFRWAFNHVALFNVMREPQKFLALYVLVFAYFFGVGVDSIGPFTAQLRRSSRRYLTVALGVALPLLYTATIFGGLDGQLHTSTIPSSYDRVNTVTNKGNGRILLLPWHLYMSYPFASNRVIGIFQSSVFQRTVISGDDLQSGDVATLSTSPLSNDVVQLLNEGPASSNFARQAAKLGVEYVVLAKSVDWRSYRWLDHQPGLTTVFSSATLTLYRNTSYRGLVAPSAQSGAPCAPARSTGVTTKPTSCSTRVRLLTNGIDALKVTATRSTWATVALSYQSGWAVNGVPARVSPYGTLLVDLRRGTNVVRFSPASSTLVAYAASLLAALALGLGARSERRSRARHRRSLFPWTSPSSPSATADKF